MKKIIITLFIISSFIISCKDNSKAAKPKSSTELSSERKAVNNDDKIDKFSNIYIYGTDAGSYFQTLYKLNKFDKMLEMTSNESIKKFGKEKILKFYSNDLKFSYKLGKLTSAKEIKEGVYTLIYISNINATKVKTEINITTENDSIKVILPEKLNDFPIIK